MPVSQFRLFPGVLLVLVSGVVLVLASGVDAAERPCSNATLERGFGYTVTGFRPGNIPFAAVGRLIFDGRGGVTTVRTLSDGGTIVRGDKGSGSYSLGSDCTGSFSIGVGGLGQLLVDFVVDDEGEEIRGIVTNAGFVLTLEGRKQARK